MAQRGRGAAGPVLKQWQCKSTSDLKWSCAVRFGILSRRNTPFPLLIHSLKTSCFFWVLLVFLVFFFFFLCGFSSLLNLKSEKNINPKTLSSPFRSWLLSYPMGC